MPTKGFIAYRYNSEIQEILWAWGDFWQYEISIKNLQNKQLFSSYNREAVAIEIGPDCSLSRIKMVGKLRCTAQCF